MVGVLLSLPMRVKRTTELDHCSPLFSETFIGVTQRVLEDLDDAGVDQARLVRSVNRISNSNRNDNSNIHDYSWKSGVFHLYVVVRKLLKQFVGRVGSGQRADGSRKSRRT